MLYPLNVNECLGPVSSFSTFNFKKQPPSAKPRQCLESIFSTFSCASIKASWCLDFLVPWRHNPIGRYSLSKLAWISTRTTLLLKVWEGFFSNEEKISLGDLPSRSKETSSTFSLNKVFVLFNSSKDCPYSLFCWVL